MLSVCDKIHANQIFIANEFSGKRVLVTGGTAGLGRAIVERLIDGGAKAITSTTGVHI
jgi:NAD(P)-dependent dehydrogenase (short-subunit alcohol dehydrogenase family)